MIDSISQTFLIIATFSTALVAILVAIYAISASYLGRETRLTRSRMEKRKDILTERLQRLQIDKESNNLETLKRD